MGREGEREGGRRGNSRESRPRAGRLSSLAHAHFRPFAAALHSQDVVEAFRADCQLYEDFTQTSTSPLPTTAAVLLGGDDRVTDRANVIGWADAAASDEFRLITIKGASHHACECGSGGEVVGSGVRGGGRAGSDRILTTSLRPHPTDVESPALVASKLLSIMN